MDKKEQTKNTILYLIQTLGEKIEGKKKIMKLMFLLEHYDFQNNKIVETKNIGNEFFIYYYGVFSTDVMQSISILSSEGKIKDGLPLTLGSNTTIQLDPETQSRADLVIKKFGDLPGYRLEVGTLRLMGIEPSQKAIYMGDKIVDILERKRAKD